MAVSIHNFFTKPVRYIMQEKVKVMEPQITVSEAVEFMKANSLGFVVVELSPGKLGIVTENDLVFRVIGAGRDPKKTPLSEVATPDPVTVPQSASLEHALKLMRDRKVRRLIVVDENKRPVGRLDQKFFFSSFVNVATGAPDSECKSWMERYIHDIMDYNVA